MSLNISDFNLFLCENCNPPEKSHPLFHSNSQQLPATLVSKSNTPPWVFSTFFKLCRLYQIAQRITFYVMTKIIIYSGWSAVLEFLELFLNCKWFLKNLWNNEFLRICFWNVLEFYFSSFIKTPLIFFMIHLFETDAFI